MLDILMVAEKPSIASSIAKALHGSAAGGMTSRRGICTEVHEFVSNAYKGEPARFKVTSVVGHVNAIDFPPQFQSWDATDPVSLFQAPVVRTEANPKAHVVRHLQAEAAGAHVLILWLDCDREGENICFEVIDAVHSRLAAGGGGKTPVEDLLGRSILRARFSAVTPQDIHRAMRSLTIPNINEARAVDARQELDLKVGVAFTRFQSKYFQGKYGNLDSSLISYGPCQTPTLGFCVARHDDIQSFQPETFWYLLPTVTVGSVGIKVDWARRRIFDQEIASMFFKMIENAKTAQVVSVVTKDARLSRPRPFNTLDLLKKCSALLGMSPHHAMSVAERLYIAGYISYPRTESTAFPSSFDIPGAVRIHSDNPVWGDYVRSLLKSGLQSPRAGVDMGDHPPITPTRTATLEELGSEQYRIYDLIARNFLASVSPDAKFKNTRAVVTIGTESFSCSGRQMISPGFTEILHRSSSGAGADDEDYGYDDAGSGDDDDNYFFGGGKSGGGGGDGDDDDDFSGRRERQEQSLPALTVGQTLPVSSLSLQQGKTRPPDYLTESELIGLMEKHGIGTDASIAVHINNICERNYVQLSSGRKMVPSPLGIVLVHGYLRIDPDIVLPTVRSNIESSITLVAEGKADHGSLVRHALGVFQKKYEYFVAKIAQMDELFEATFSPLAATGKPLSRCGKCRRYMKYISLRPQRLHCANCDETYALPQFGTIKLFLEQKCPLDGFEMVLFGLGSGQKSYPLCPYCYNHPPFEDSPKAMGCNNCTHPTCEHSLTNNWVMPCSECSGTIVIDVASAPKWRLCCNTCNNMIVFPQIIHSLDVAKDKETCEDCGAMLLDIEFNKKDTPLKDGATRLASCCLQCNEMLATMAKISHSRTRISTRGRGRGGRGGRGRGGGRGGRGRPRGGGRPGVDPKMTFDGF